MSAEKIIDEISNISTGSEFTKKDIERLRGSIKIEYSLCKQLSLKLRKLDQLLKKHIT